MADMNIEHEHLRFKDWAASAGVIMNGVAPAKFPGRGMGMVATKTIDKNEHLLTIPFSVMLTIDSIPASFIKRFPKETPAQCILAAFLTNGERSLTEKWDVWRAVWPKEDEFRDSLPLFWPEHLQPLDNGMTSRDLLPPAACGKWWSLPSLALEAGYETIYQNVLGQQEKRFNDAWNRVRSVFPETDWAAFAYNWSVINSRSFYYVSPGKNAPADWNDALGMVPFADYFNHTEYPQARTFYTDCEYVIQADRRIEQDEEIYLSYGSHSNDFLWFEYGFFLDHNPSDALYLDDIILKELKAADRTELINRGLFGNYQVTAKGACSRTHAVACMEYMERKSWMSHIAGKSQKGFDARKSADIICRWIEIYLCESNDSIGGIKAAIERGQGLDDATADSRKVSTALKRWDQIMQLCNDARDAVSSQAREDNPWPRDQ